MSDIRVVVIDAQPLFRAGVISILETERDMLVVGQGASAGDAIRLVRDMRPSVIVLDISMLEGGIGVIEAILSHCPDVKPVMLTSVADNDLVCAAMQAGAWGYVLKNVNGSELAQTVRIIHQGERYVTPALAARLFAEVSAPPPKPSTDRFAGLTCREEQILGLIAEGLSNKQIGGRLEISEKTVKHYLTIILHKLDVRSRVQAAVLACSRSSAPEASRRLTSVWM